MQSFTMTPTANDERLPHRPARMVGGRALLTAVIHQAQRDFHKGNGQSQDAAEYFAGATYRTHLELLGLPEGWLPKTITIEREL